MVGPSFWGVAYLQEQNVDFTVLPAISRPVDVLCGWKLVHKIILAI